MNWYALLWFYQDYPLMLVTKAYRYELDPNNSQRTNGYTDTVVDVVYSDGKTERLESKSIVSIIMPREADLLVRTAGFKIAEEYGDNDFLDYKPEHWKMVLVLKKETL